MSEIVEQLNSGKFDKMSIKEMSDEDYFDTKDFLSSSSIKKLMITPRHFQNPKDYESGTKNKNLHRIFLEPEKFNNLVVLEAGKVNSKTNTIIVENAEMQGQEWIRLKEYNELEEIKKGILETTPELEALINSCEKETAFFTKSKKYPLVKLRMKADLIDHKNKVIYDLKNGGSPAKGLTDHYCKQLADQNGWFFQDSLYTDILEEFGFKGYLFRTIIIEEKKPFGITTWEADDEQKEYYKIQLEKQKAILQNCFAKNHWPCYPKAVKFWKLSEYEYTKMNEELESTRQES